MAAKTIDQAGTEVVPARAGALKQYTIADVTDMALAMLAGVPEAADDDGAGIIGRLLDADNWEELNQESKLPNGQDVAGVKMAVQAIAKRASDLAADETGTGIQLGWYLMIDAVRTGHGDQLRWQTSAPGLMVPLMKLHQWGKLPAVVEVTRADKPTKRGFYPLSMTVHAIG